MQQSVRSNIFVRSVVFSACLLLLLLTGCTSTGAASLKYSEVALETDPSIPIAKKSTKLVVHIHNENYVSQEAEVQLQINSKSSLPSLLDATREGEDYSTTYEFPAAGEYTVTIHLEYDEDHYAIAKKVVVNDAIR